MGRGRKGGRKGGRGSANYNVGAVGNVPKFLRGSLARALGGDDDDERIVKKDTTEWDDTRDDRGKDGAYMDDEEMPVVVGLAEGEMGEATIKQLLHEENEGRLERATTPTKTKAKGSLRFKGDTIAAVKEDEEAKRIQKWKDAFENGIEIDFEDELDEKIPEPEPEPSGPATYVPKSKRTKYVKPVSKPSSGGSVSKADLLKRAMAADDSNSGSEEVNKPTRKRKRSPSPGGGKIVDEFGRERAAPRGGGADRVHGRDDRRGGGREDRGRRDDSGRGEAKRDRGRGDDRNRGHDDRNRGTDDRNRGDRNRGADRQRGAGESSRRRGDEARSRGRGDADRGSSDRDRRGRGGRERDDRNEDKDRDANRSRDSPPPRKQFKKDEDELAAMIADLGETSESKKPASSREKEKIDVPAAKVAPKEEATSKPEATSQKKKKKKKKRAAPQGGLSFDMADGFLD